MHYDINKKIEQLAMCKPARRKRRKRRSYSLHQEVLSLVGNANTNARPERRVIPRSALAVMNRALANLSSIDENSRRFAALREVNKFISLHQDTFKAHNSKTEYADLLPIGHPLSSLNLTVSEKQERESYAAWLAADSSISSEAQVLIATAYALEPGSVERKHAFTRLEVTRHAIPLFIKFDPIQALVAAYQFRDGNSSAARRARVATQWRDRYGRWVEMGRGLDFKFKLPDGQIGTAAGTYVGIDSSQGFIDFEGKQVANSGFVEVSGHPTLPDGIYSIKSANATPAKARIPQQALKRAKVKTPSSTRKATAEESLSPDIPDLQTLLDSRVDSPAGWEKQSDGSYLSDDDYKLIETGEGFALHRLDKDGNTGDKVADVLSWAEAQKAAENDEADYDKFKASIQEKPIARIQEEAAPRSLIPQGVETSGALPNGVEYSVEQRKQRVEVFPGRYADVDGVTVTLDRNTYENRKRIKELGFKWNAQDKVWRKNYIDSDLFGKGRNVNRIKEELDGIGGGTMPRYEGDNESIRWHLQDGYNEMIIYSRENNSPDVVGAKDALWDVIEELRKAGPNDRKNASEKLENFIKLIDAPNFPRNERTEVAKRNAQQGIDLIAQKEADRGVVPQEAPEVPKNEDNVPTKTPTDATPTSPQLFGEFDVPDGAFRLRTVEYEPAGREDQESRNYTDDPERLATRFPLPVLTRALVESLIGDKDDSIMDDIVDDTVDDDGDALDIEDAYDVADTPAPRAGRAQATGAGKLEFDAGDEFVPAEALYNAVFLAGGDPNRVIANAYDAVHGDRRNAEKLNNASGELPSTEEQELIDDIMQEIRQIESSREPGDSPVSNVVDNPEPESELKGDLIYNNPIDWENPDYYTLDPNPYQATVPEPDENGYTDNPKLLATYFFEADLIQQLTNSITDGSGSAYFFFGTEETDYMSGTYEIPSEAIRDALQYQGVNTNTLLEDLKAEANNMEEKPVATPEPEPQPQVEAPAEPVAAEEAPSFEQVPFDGAISILTDWYDRDMLVDAEFIAYLPSDGSIAFKDAWDTLYVARPNETIAEANTSEEWLTDPRGAGQAGWKLFTDEQRRSLAQKIIGGQEETPAPSPTPAPEPTPALQYPGPRERGYSPNNTTKIRGGVVVGKGSRVQAVKDGKVGTVVAIQNDPEYLRIKFDDGTTAVRAAAKVRAISNPDGKAAVPQAAPSPEREPMKPSTDIGQRLDRPVVPAPRIARSGETSNVNDESTRPDFLEGKTQEGVVQSDYAIWGDRDAEIAKATNDRVSFETLEQEAYKYHLAEQARNGEEARDTLSNISALMGDAYGDRSGISFGGEFFTTRVKSVRPYVYLKGGTFGRVSEDDIKNGKASVQFEISLDVLDVSGRVVGKATRTIAMERSLDRNMNVTKTSRYGVANYLSISEDQKQTGFGSAYNRWVENWYIANGVEKVIVSAAGGGAFQGGYVWAINGYNWQEADDALSILRSMRREVRNSLEEAQVEALAQLVTAAEMPDGSYDMSKMPTPFMFAHVGYDPEKDPEKDTWLGRKVMIRSSWAGVKHLNPTAREQIQSVNYGQIRNARRRVLSNQNTPNLSSDALAVVDSDKFRNNPTIAPYYTQIRDALRNNRSIAVLSPDAKNALNAYVSQEILSKRDRSLPWNDIFSLRGILENEYRADYGYAYPFTFGDALSEFTVRDFADAADGTSNKLQDLGFKVEWLNGLGINARGDIGGSMFQVTHTPSGQKFYVKNDAFIQQIDLDTPAGVTELEATILLKAAGMQGVHDTRIGRDENERNLVIMSQAGATIPLVEQPQNAGTGLQRGVTDANGNKVPLWDSTRFVEALDTPEDLIRMSIFDILGNNQDRHNGNWMVAFDKATGKLRIFPVDNTVGELKRDESNIAEFIEYGSFSELDAYQDYMPKLIDRIGTDGMLKIYENEINKTIKNLDNPLYQPKGFEMDKIIEKWGSYDAFKDAMTERLNKLITKGSAEYEALKGAMTVRYWN